MNLLFIHAHCDDYEVTSAGTFELWRHRDGPRVARRVIICTDGAAGHHAMTREATARRRREEQEASARLGEYEFRLLQDREGRPFREGCIQPGPEFLGSLWNEIRQFEPDYLFCPPLPADVLAGVHADHLAVAEAVRRVAYLINVPHAFTPEYPADETTSAPCKVPAILNTYDGYMAGTHGHDLAIDIEPVFDQVAALSWCHQSQFCEWLPWVDRHNIRRPQDLGAWKTQLREIFERRKRGLHIAAPGLFEVFAVTAWGIIPRIEELQRDFPGLHAGASRLDRLAQRLDSWREAAGE